MDSCSRKSSVYSCTDRGTTTYCRWHQDSTRSVVRRNKMWNRFTTMDHRSVGRTAYSSQPHWSRFSWYEFGVVQLPPHVEYTFYVSQHACFHGVCLKGLQRSDNRVVRSHPVCKGCACHTQSELWIYRFMLRGSTAANVVEFPLPVRHRISSCSSNISYQIVNNCCWCL